MYTKGIKHGIEKGLDSQIISRKIYITYPTFAFIGEPDLEFELLNSISEEFNTPITSIQVAGSAKTGFSYSSGKPFKKGKSDLDIAIIDPLLFQMYCEIVFIETKGLRDLTGFQRTEEGNDFTSYKKYLAAGFFRPDFMPICDAKKDWFNFFNKISENYIDIFSDINAGIFFSQTFFEYKQIQSINTFKV